MLAAQPVHVQGGAGGRHGTEGSQSQGLPASPGAGRLQFVGQDELAEFGAARVALRGDVHVVGVGPQQPGALQREGDALTTAVNLRRQQTYRILKRKRMCFGKTWFGLYLDLIMYRDEN